MEAFLEYVLKQIAGHPDDVVIEKAESDVAVDFLLHVHPDDVGRIIGRHGRTISAIRTLVNASASKYGKHATVEIAGQPASSPPPPAPETDPAS
jgi:predicted RNA-binding protein YlqC (UPF0109 family)